MKKLISNDSKYDLPGGRIDYNKIYDDCIIYYKEYGIYDAGMLTNNQCRNQIINFSIETSKNTKQLATGSISEEQFFVNQEAIFKNKYNVSDDEIKIYNNFGVKVVKQCGVLTQKDIHEYATALNTVISHSELSYDKKELVISTAQIAVNSSLCWSEKK